jgi:hypothetical protein
VPLQPRHIRIADEIRERSLRRVDQILLLGLRQGLSVEDGERRKRDQPHPLACSASCDYFREHVRSFPVDAFTGATLAMAATASVTSASITWPPATIGVMLIRL